MEYYHKHTMTTEEINALNAAYDNLLRICDSILLASKEYETARAVCHAILQGIAKRDREERRKINTEKIMVEEPYRWQEVCPRPGVFAEKVIALQNLKWKTWDDIPLHLM